MLPVDIRRIPILLVLLVTTGQLLVNAAKSSIPRETPNTNEAVNDIKHQVKSLAQIISNIQHDYERQIQGMKDETAAQKDQIQDMKDETAALKDQIHGIKAEHHVQIDTLNHQIEILREEIISKLQTYPAVENALNYTSLSNNIVYFHVQIQGFIGSSIEDTVIPFDIIVLNQGSGYDPASGLFTAPVSGFYHISYEVLADDSCGTNNMCVKLFVNSAIVSQSCSEVYASGGSGVTLQLSAGNTVGVKVDQGPPCNVLYSGSAAYNHFSGFLIYQIIE